MQKRGKIKANGVILEAHESATVEFLLSIGYDVELIPKSNSKGIHTPDLVLDNNLKWEMKSPKGTGKWCIKNTLQEASHQSENVIIDLHRAKLPQEACLRELKARFSLSKRLKRIKIITKSRKVLDFHK